MLIVPQSGQEPDCGFRLQGGAMSTTPPTDTTSTPKPPADPADVADARVQAWLNELLRNGERYHETVTPPADQATGDRRQAS